jgi:hypothetical protein
MLVELNWSVHCWLTQGSCSASERDAAEDVLNSTESRFREGYEDGNGSGSSWERELL